MFKPAHLSLSSLSIQLHGVIRKECISPEIKRKGFPSFRKVFFSKSILNDLVFTSALFKIRVFFFFSFRPVMSLNIETNSNSPKIMHRFFMISSEFSLVLDNFSCVYCTYKRLFLPFSHLFRSNSKDNALIAKPATFYHYNCSFINLLKHNRFNNL